MIQKIHLSAVSRTVTSPGRCSLLNGGNLMKLISRHKTAFANDSFRPRNNTNRLAQSAERYMMKMKQKYQIRLQKRLNPKGVRLSEGIPPSLLGDIDEGLKAVLKRRQRILDKIFMENFTEVLATNPIGDFLKQLGVQITHCQVTKDYHILHVYYHCDKSKAEEVVKELNRTKGVVRSLLTQKYIMGKVPTIEYMYDLSYEKNSELTERLSSLDLGPEEREFNEKNREDDPSKASQEVGGDYRTDEFIPPIPDSEPFKSLGTSRRVKSLTNFDPEHAFQYTQNPYDDQKAASRYLKFTYPDDMRLDTFSLDYKNMINKIMFNLIKNRSPSRSFNANSDPLPPVDWSTVKPMSPVPPDMSDPAQNFKGRVDLMRKFLVENRKKKQILAREAKRAKDEMMLEASNNLNQALDNLGFNSDYPSDESTNSSLDDYEYLHSKLDKMEEEDDKEEN